MGTSPAERQQDVPRPAPQGLGVERASALQEVGPLEGCRFRQGSWWARCADGAVPCPAPPLLLPLLTRALAHAPMPCRTVLARAFRS